MSEFNVEPGELQTASAAIRAAVDEVSGWSLSDVADGGSFGHDGLAAAFGSMCTGAERAVAAAHTSAHGHADSLDASSGAYSGQDAGVAGRMSGEGSALVGSDG